MTNAPAVHNSIADDEEPPPRIGLMVTMQPGLYRDAASRLDQIGRSVLSGVNEPAVVLPAVVDELNSLAGDRSGATLKAFGDLADRLAAAGSVNPATLDEIITTLRSVADDEDRVIGEANKLWD